MTSTPPDERFDELETHLTFLDDAVSSLDETGMQQSRRLQQLEKALVELRRELGALRASLAGDGHDEPRSNL